MDDDGGVFAGIAIIAIIDRLVPEEINPHEPATTEEEARRKRLMKTGMFTAFALAIHNFPEGFATFLSGLEAPEIAIPVAVAIAIHNIPEGIAVAVPLRSATGSRKKAFWWATLSGLAEPLGALIGFALLMPFIGPMTFGICFAVIAGIMVFISLDELLPTAEETGEHHCAIYGLSPGWRSWPSPSRCLSKVYFTRSAVALTAMMMVTITAPRIKPHNIDKPVSANQARAPLLMLSVTWWIKP